jgi:hypothetical protein
MEFCECHLPGTTGTVIALLTIWDLGNPTWSERMASACDLARPTYHVGWAFMARYAQHVSSMLQEVTTVSSYQRKLLEEYDHQVEAKDRLITDLRKGNRELLQWTHTLERCNKELHDDLLHMYRNLDFKTDSLDNTHT